MVEPIVVLDLIDCIRKRPAMYVRSTDQRGVQHVAFEAIDNAVDQFLAGRATRLDVSIDGNKVRVADNGRGGDDADGPAAWFRHLTQYHHTNTADGHALHIHAMGGGIGLVALNALTRRLVVRTVRNGVARSQSLARGIAQGPVVAAATTERDGTTLEFEFDPEIFPAPDVDQPLLRAMLRRLSWLFPGLALVFQGEQFANEAGLLGLVRTEFALDGGPEFSVSAQFDGALISVAAVGETAGATRIAGFANAAPTQERSSHVVGLKRALTRAKWRPAGAAISVVIGDPAFSGPTRETLHMPGLEKRVSDFVAAALRLFLRQ